MKKLFNILFLLVSLLTAFTSCDRSVHEGGSSLSVQLIWDQGSLSDGDKADSIPEIKGVTVYFYGDDGTLRDSVTYDNSEEVAADNHPMPSGDYVIVTTSNVDGALATNKEKPVSLNDLMIEKEEGEPMKQAYYSIQWVHVDETGVTISKQELRPVLAQLQVNVFDAPTNSDLKVEVLNSASKFYPGRKNDSGSYGIPSTDITPYTLPAPTETKSTRAGADAAAETETVSTGSYLMPTATGQAKAMIRVTFTPAGSAASTTQLYETEAMLSGKRYVLNLNHNMEIVLNSYDYGTSDWDRVDF